MTILNTFINSDILTLPLTQPKNKVKLFENQKMNATTSTPKQHTIFHQYLSFTKYLYFLRCRPISTSMPQIFSPSKFELFGLKNPKFLTSQNSSWHIILNLNQPETAQKIPNQSSSWPWNGCTHTFGWPCLQVLWSGLLWFGLLFQSSSNHLKTPTENTFLSENIGGQSKGTFRWTNKLDLEDCHIDCGRTANSFGGKATIRGVWSWVVELMFEWRFECFRDQTCCACQLRQVLRECDYECHTNLSQAWWYLSSAITRLIHVTQRCGLHQKRGTWWTRNYYFLHCMPVIVTYRLFLQFWLRGPCVVVLIGVQEMSFFPGESARFLLVRKPNPTSHACRHVVGGA